jgi:hypothetical protein
MRAPLPSGLTFPVIWTAFAALLALICAAFTPFMIKASSDPAPGAFSNTADKPPGGDFVVFYAAGSLAQQGRIADAYDVKALHASYQDFTAATGRESIFAYPPVVLPPMAAIAALPPWPALGAWMAALALCAGASAWFATRRASSIGGALLYPGTALTVAFGQTSLFAAPSFALALTWWTTRPLLAGAALGALIWKPHLALGAGLIALATRQWRVVAGGVLGALGLVFLTLPFVGFEAWMAFANALGAQADRTADGVLTLTRMPTAFAAARAYGMDGAGAMLVHALAVLAGMAAVLRLWRCEALWVRAFALTISAVLISPYVYDYDLGLLSLPFAILLGEAFANRAMRTWPTLAWLILLAATPILASLVHFAAALNVGAFLVAGLILAAVIGPLRLTRVGAPSPTPLAALHPA